MKKKIMSIITKIIFDQTIYDIGTSIKLAQFDGPDSFECEFEINSQKVMIRCREDSNGIIINVIIDNEVVASRGYDSECNKNKIGEELETVLRWVID